MSRRFTGVHTGTTEGGTVPKWRVERALVGVNVDKDPYTNLVNEISRQTGVHSSGRVYETSD